MLQAVISQLLSSGGYTTADPKATDVKDAAKFAINNQYPTIKMSYKILSALKQVVAGTKYDMKLSVTNPSTKVCTVREYVVLRKLDQSYALLSRELTTLKCAKK